jgi:hypothetical protein
MFVGGNKRSALHRMWLLAAQCPLVITRAAPHRRMHYKTDVQVELDGLRLSKFQGDAPAVCLFLQTMT